MKKLQKCFSVAAVSAFLLSVATSAWAWGVAIGNPDGSGICFGSGNACSGSSGGGNAGGGWSLANPYGLPSGSIMGIITNLLLWLLGILGVVGIIAFVISGIIYLVSAGDETTIERAKRAMLWSIVGIIVGLAGFVIIQAIFSFLGGANSQF